MAARTRCEVEDRLARRVLGAQVRFALQNHLQHLEKVRRLLREAEHQWRELVLLVLHVDRRAVRHEVLHDLELVLSHRDVQRCV